MFDTGNCLWNDVLTQRIDIREMGECKPFRKDFRKQLHHVSDFSWVDLDKLKAVPDVIADIFKSHGMVEEDRIEIIRRGVTWRTDFLEKAINNPALLRRKPHRNPRS